MNIFWMIVWHSETGDFHQVVNYQGESVEMAGQSFEDAHPVYKVIHIGAGNHPPKTYQSLHMV